MSEMDAMDVFVPGRLCILGEDHRLEVKRLMYFY